MVPRLIRFIPEPHIRKQGPWGRALRTIAERLPHFAKTLISMEPPTFFEAAVQIQTVFI
jgi:hypothetical protein